MKTKEITFTFYPQDYMAGLLGKWTCHQRDNDGETTFGIGDTELSALENLIEQLDTDDLRVEETTPYAETPAGQMGKVHQVIRDYLALDNVDRHSAIDIATTRSAAMSLILDEIGIDDPHTLIEEDAA
jgi:hypothetical protein